MTKLELREKLESGKTLDQVLRFKWGDECLIYKHDTFLIGDSIIYITDTSIHDISLYDPVTDLETLDELMTCCYTGNDFVEECGGDVEKAEQLFWYCDWQHPSSALPEIDNEEDE